MLLLLRTVLLLFLTARLCIKKVTDPPSLHYIPLLLFRQQSALFRGAPALNIQKVHVARLLRQNFQGV